MLMGRFGLQRCVLQHGLQPQKSHEPGKLKPWVRARPPACLVSGISPRPPRFRDALHSRAPCWCWDTCALLCFLPRRQGMRERDSAIRCFGNSGGDFSSCLPVPTHDVGPQAAGAGGYFAISPHVMTILPGDEHWAPARRQ